MKIINRRNILDLIGQYRGRYHSCIITCYSLDFSFFEERVLPSLRYGNMKNINLFVDGHFLELAQENTTGKEFGFNKTYNFHPIYEKGVFHPKIMLLTGVKYGLLIIGSGNMTSSGLSTNDEIWGAFHLNSIDNENAPLFASVWKYLQEYTNNSYGFVAQKIDWIRKYSPWLDELPIADGEINIESIQQEIRFVYNDPNQSIYKQLINNSPKEKVEEITVISPFYDKKGSVLKELFNHYNPKVFNCIVEGTFGLLPHELDEDITKFISFNEWSSCKKDYNNEFNRLHAKIIYIKYQNNTQIMLLGSANATFAGMGTSKIKPTNAEASLLIKRTSSESWLSELGINIPETSISISKLGLGKGMNPESIPRIKYKYRILYSELRGTELSIYLNKEASKNTLVSVFSRTGENIENITANTNGKILIAIIKDPEEIFKISISNEEGERVSNFSIIHHFEALVKCNPNPDQEKLDALFEGDYPDGEGITALLQFVEYNWADDEKPNLKSSSVSSSRSHFMTKSKDQDKKQYEKLDAKEFNIVSNEILLKQSGELSHPNIKIVDFLNLISSGIKIDNDFVESEEQKILEELDLESEGEGSEIKSKVKHQVNSLKEKHAIERYFKKLQETYQNKLSFFYKEKRINATPNEVISLKSISNLLIALQLIHNYQGKKFSVLDEDNDSLYMREISYLIDGTSYSDVSTIKGFLSEVLGKFLLLTTAGFKVYEYDILNQKLDQYRKQLLIRSIFTLLNLRWNHNEYKCKETSLLNLLYFLTPNENNIEFLETEFLDRITVLKNNSKFTSNRFNENFKHFIETSFPQYIRWFKRFTDIEKRNNYLIKDTKNLRSDNIIFSSKIGFNYFKRFSLSNTIKLELNRVGYQKGNDEYLMDHFPYGNKCIVYK